jgi:hypothetical protein
MNGFEFFSYFFVVFLLLKPNYCFPEANDVLAMTFQTYVFKQTGARTGRRGTEAGETAKTLSPPDN